MRIRNSTDRKLTIVQPSRDAEEIEVDGLRVVLVGGDVDTEGETGDDDRADTGTEGRN
jgi:hypothetical protein